MSVLSDVPVPAQFRSFEGKSPGRARSAASKWLGDFTQHGPLDIRSIRVIPNEDRFLAVLTYSDMTLRWPSEDLDGPTAPRKLSA